MRTALVNQIRGFLLERGIAVARGRRTLEKALPGLLEDHAGELGAMLCGLIEHLRAQWRAVEQPIAALDEQILALARQDATSQRLMAIPGVGPMLATALVAAIGSGAAGFQNGRSLAAPSALPAQRRSLRDRIDAFGIDRWASSPVSTAPAAKRSSWVWPGTATAICADCPRRAQRPAYLAAPDRSRCDRWCMPRAR